ncbi:MAG: hypothetical protein RMJ55_12780 [Roseiflexaceae bacterium]|nr:hypothetical protein [Roseiflexus sp.]MDW8214427.1 hypothetical protein [Roseiflexaceae bacterium]
MSPATCNFHACRPAATVTADVPYLTRQTRRAARQPRERPVVTVTSAKTTFRHAARRDDPEYTLPIASDRHCWPIRQDL